MDQQQQYGATAPGALEATEFSTTEAESHQDALTNRSLASRAVRAAGFVAAAGAMVFVGIRMSGADGVPATPAVAVDAPAAAADVAPPPA